MNKVLAPKDTLAFFTKHSVFYASQQPICPLEEFSTFFFFHFLTLPRGTWGLVSPARV